MADFKAVIEHEDHALGWGDGKPCVRTGEDIVVLDGSSKIAWLIHLPFKKVQAAVKGKFHNYVVEVDGWPEDIHKSGLHGDSTDYVSAVILYVLFNGDEAERLTALSWIKEMGVKEIGDRVAVALRNEAFRGISDATKAIAMPLLEEWREDHKKIPSKTDAELKQLVLDMLENRIFTSAQCGPHDNIGMVFMPLALGALSVPDAALPERPRVPPAPEMPKEPVMPSEPAPRKEPRSPEEIKEDPKEIARLDHEVRWNRLKPEAIELYRHNIKLQNEGQMAAHQRKLEGLKEGYDRELTEWKERCAKIRADYESEVTSLDDRVKAWETENAEILAEADAWEKLYEDWVKEYRGDIGIFYEYYDKAMPRSCNGLPCFMSFAILSWGDWERVWKAYEKETKRREEIEV